MHLPHIGKMLVTVLLVSASTAWAQEPIAPPDDFDAMPPPPSTPDPRPVTVEPYPYEPTPAVRRYDDPEPDYGPALPPDDAEARLLDPNARKPHSVFDRAPDTRVVPRSGDVLDFPRTPAKRIPPERTLPQRSLPTRSMTMTEVAAQYGEPLVRHPTVGDPPITRWDYPDFSVFFEHRLVLHSVVPENPPKVYHEDQLLPGY